MKTYCDMAAEARIVEPEEMAVARQWLCKHVSTQPNHTTAATDIQQ
jgi:hypothetical protein